MHWFSSGVAMLVAVGIIGIGLMYLLHPQKMTPNFGLPIPDSGLNTQWWLRLKGARDVVSGLVVLATMAWGSSLMLGMILLIEALIPLADMSLILAARGSTRIAVYVHGVTAMLMILGAIPLIVGAA